MDGGLKFFSKIAESKNLNKSKATNFYNILYTR
jgi:hypothetical protein